MRYLFLGIGWIFIILGVIGIFVPVLPTAPFVIVAGYCFSRGSQRWHHWLLTRPIIGPMVANWESNGVIELRPKIYATVMIVIMFGSSLALVNVSQPIQIALVLTGVGVLVFIWTRPSRVPS